MNIDLPAYKGIQNPWIKTLTWAAVLLSAAHLTGVLTHWPIWFLQLLFDMDRETTLQSWFSSIVWALCALAARQCSETEWVISRKRVLKITAAFLVLLSLDEAAMLHERISQSIYHFIGKEEGVSIFQPSWIFVLGPLVLPVLIAGGIALKQCFRDSRSGFFVLLGLTVTVCGGMIVEMFPVLLNRYSGVFYEVEVLAEETLEMLGAILILKGLTQYAHTLSLSVKNGLNKRLYFISRISEENRPAGLGIYR